MRFVAVSTLVVVSSCASHHTSPSAPSPSPAVSASTGGSAAPADAAASTAASAAVTPSASVVAPPGASNGAPGAADAAGTAGAPASASCGMPAALWARGWRSELAPTSRVETPAFVEGTTTLVALPDIQYYSSCESRHFGAQTRFIAEERARRNVAGVVTLGDLTDRNTPREWQYVQQGLHVVEALTPVVLVTGNHDHGDGGRAERRGSLLERFFPAPPGAAARVLVETRDPGDIENAYYRIALGRVTLGVLALEWSPRAATVAWANRVLEKYASDRVVILTHAYLYHDGTRYDWRTKGKRQEWNPLSYGTAGAPLPGGAAEPPATPAAALPPAEAPYDGEMLWNELVKRHAGVFLMLSGHVLVGGAGVLSSRGEHGNVVHQVLVNYQMLKEGGLGYLRLLELLPSGKTLRMKSFSPTLGLFATGPDQAFDLTLEPPLF